MSHNSACYAILVLVSGLIGCGGGDSSSTTGGESAVAPAETDPTGAPSAVSSPQLPAKQPAAQPGDVSSATGQGAGEPFDVKQFLESRAAPADNAAPLYLAAFDQASLVRDAEMLNLEAGTIQPQQVEQALQAAAPVFEQIDQAQTKSSCLFEVDLMPRIAQARSIARASRVQLYWASVKGDPDLAASAVTRCLRLSRDLRPRGETMSQAVSIALEGIGLDGIAQFTLNDPKLTMDQCDQMLALLVEHQQQGLDPYDEGCRMTYIKTRQTVEDLQAGQMSPEVKQTMDRLGRLPQSISYEAERAACDRIFAIVLQEAQTPHFEVAAADELQTEMRKLADEANRGTGAVIVLLQVPALQALSAAATRVKANLAGVQLLTALRRYELAHGKLPTTLAEAVADTVLKTVPTDPYSGQPMRFAIVNSKATVYSTGPDLKDDGGRIEWKYGTQPGDYLFAMDPLPAGRPRPPAAESPPPEAPAAPAAKTAEIRTWTSTVGSTIEAELTGVEDEVAILKKRDGKVLRVPLDKLSEQDQAWIRQQVEE
ncbi:MAG: SHD1 domain-containing protein [Planctomycetota bacterium]|nr:SHD1 domain-containing protein [Planctomycetota bacterium]